MRRVEEYQIARDYRRFVCTALPLGIAAFGLVGYRWYTFLRAHSSAVSQIAEKFSDVSAWATLPHWISVLWTIRESLPMVEASLFAVNIAILVILALKFRGMWKSPLAQRNVMQV